MKDGKEEERGHTFDCCCAGHPCSFSSVNWSVGSFIEGGWVQRLGGCRLLVLKELCGGRQPERRWRQQPIHENPQCCSPASCIHSPNKEPQWCPLLSWLDEVAPGDGQSHVGGREDGVSVCGGLVGFNTTQPVYTCPACGLSVAPQKGWCHG